MTCIIGLETKGGVLIGGDSAAVDGWDIHTTRLTKVFQRGDFLIGYTTSFRMGQILQYRLTVEPQTEAQTDLEYLATTFVDAVRVCLKEGGFTKVENQQEEGGNFLVGYKGRLYSIEADFHVNSSEDGFMAMGCGAKLALGCMWATKDWPDPDARVIAALEAAGHFSNGVCLPYYVKFLETTG